MKKKYFIHRLPGIPVELSTNATSLEKSYDPEIDAEKVYSMIMDLPYGTQKALGELIEEKPIIEKSTSLES